MLDNLQHLLPGYTAKLTCVALIYAACRYVNNTVSEDTRIRVALWLLGSGSRPRWHQYVPPVFTSLFGLTTFSWKAVRAVVCVMLLSGVLLHIEISFIGQLGWVESLDSIAVALMKGGARDAFYQAPDGASFFHFEKMDGDVLIFGSHDMSLSEGADIEGVAILLLLLLIYNLPLEYLSMTKSRWLIRIAHRKPDGVGRLLWILMAEVLITALIAILSAKVVSQAFNLFSERIAQTPPWRIYVVLLRQVIVSLALPCVHVVWMASSLVMASVSKLCIWASRGIPHVAKFLSEERIEREPITLIGELMAAVCFLAIAWI